MRPWPYSNKVLDHYNNPRNVGQLRPRPTRPSGTGLVGAPECGDVMKLQIKVNPATGVIEDAQVQDLRLRQRHRLQQPGHRVAQGQDHRRGDGDQEHRDRRGAGPAAGEGPLLVLAEDAIKAAIGDYKEKWAKAEARSGRRRVLRTGTSPIRGGTRIWR